MYNNLDMSDPIHKVINDLIKEGLIEYAYNEEGEMILNLTNTGQEVTNTLIEQEKFEHE